MIRKFGQLGFGMTCTALVLAISACAKVADSASSGKLNVLVTISTFESFARGVGGDRVSVTSLVPVGASPEDYQPTPGDIERVHAADVLVENGLGLETWLARTLDNAKNANLITVTATDGLRAKGDNPHLWMDPEFARAYVRKIRDALIARDPAGRATYTTNAAAYDASLVRLEREIATEHRDDPGGFPLDDRLP